MNEQHGESFVDAPRQRLRAASLRRPCWLGGCASSKNPAPVEDRAVGARAATAAAPPAPGSVPAQPAADAAKPLPGAENAGKPGYYTVKPGDTMIRIGLETGQNWKDLVKWNNLDNPNVIEVGQVLRVVPPGADAGRVHAAGRPPPRSRRGRSMPSPRRCAAQRRRTAAGAAPAAPAACRGDRRAAPRATATTTSTGCGLPRARSAACSRKARARAWRIAGKAGDPVLAAADGRVVYAGSGLRGYGNLVILKHNNTYLTAYAHNQTLLVKEDQAVRRGQKIAEMGSTDAERVQLHFEIRKQGKPVDPAKLLPPR